MQRISTSNRVLNLFGLGKDGFKNGDLASGVLPTEFNAAWCNSVQEELANVVEAGGLALNAGSVVQLLMALRSTGVFQTAAQLDNTTKVATTAFVYANAVGRLVNIQVFPATGIYAPSSSRVSKIIVESVGGGGAGGGAVATSSSGSAGGGGGAGCYAKVLFTAVPASAVVTIGAGGAGTSGANGGAGGLTSFGAYVSVSGGNGGGASAAFAVYPVSGPPAAGGGTVSTSGSAISTSPGGSGQWGIVFATNALGGAGGSSMLGQGAAGSGSGSFGNSGVGKGSGGGGACNSGTLSAQTGGTGAPGVVIVYEYE